jgi:hypothetical protein
MLGNFAKCADGGDADKETLGIGDGRIEKRVELGEWHVVDGVDEGIDGIEGDFPGVHVRGTSSFPEPRV